MERTRVAGLAALALFCVFGAWAFLSGARVEAKRAADRRAEGLAAWEGRAPTLETTRLGGGIGFHGWAREWEDTGPRHLSWGCVVLHLSDIQTFYERVPEGSMVVIF